MIYWYSGTGNSRLVAQRLSELLGDEAAPIIGGNSTAHISVSEETAPDNGEPENDSLADLMTGIVFPVYSWGVPPIVLRFLETLGSQADSPKRIWMVCTCGDETGMAPRMFCRHAEKQNLKVVGAWSVQTPNNYVLLPGFDVDPEALAEEKLRLCTPRIAEIAEQIKTLSSDATEIIEDCHLGSWPRLKTGVVYPLFVHWGIWPERWTVTDACTGCGACCKACPTGNIKIEKCADNPSIKPIWGKDCLSCTACYHVCPVNAVQYGSATKSKGQYSLIRILKRLKE